MPNAYGAPPPAYGPTAPGFFPNPAQLAINRSASWALGLSLGALPLCCFPASALAIFFGIRTMRLAKAAGVPVPTRAVVGTVLGALWTVFVIVAMIIGQIQQRQTAARYDVVEGRLSGKREAAQLDKSVACDLVEERILKDGFDGDQNGLDTVKCDGELKATTDKASLAGVTFSFNGGKSKSANVCYARGATRWYVLAMRAGIDCATVPIPPAPSGGSETELAESEKKAREAVPKLAEVAAAKRFADGLFAIRSKIKQADLPVKNCDKSMFTKYLPSGDERLKVDSVDYDYLNAAADGGADARWKWLTSDRVRTVLDEARGTAPDGTPMMDMAKEAGPFVVVYQGVDKTWPVVQPTGKWIGKKMAYSPGTFAGFMIVGNYETGDVSCAIQLGFTNGTDITYDEHGLSSEQDRATEAVEDDLKDHFEDMATEKMKKLGSGALRLGYKVLE
jgi:hypothetical protein